MNVAFNKFLNKWVNIDKWLANNQVNVKKCCNNSNCRCSCCKVLTPSILFKSNVTGKQFIMSNYGSLNCKSCHVIYLITCGECGIQYVGQTTQPLHIRLNAHRSCVKRNGSTFLYKHFNDGHSFDKANIQIIDVYVPNGSLSLDFLEQFWIDTLCTAYPLGLNDRIDGLGNISKTNTSMANIYFKRPIARRPRGHGIKSKFKNVNSRFVRNDDDIDNNITVLKDLFEENKNRFYIKIRSLNKKLMYKIILNLSSCNSHFSYVLSSFYHNRYKTNSSIENIDNREHIIIPFISKAVDLLSINSILRDKKLISLLPQVLQKKLPLRIFYKYNIPIGRKLFNYNTFLKSLTKDKITEILNNDCSCQNSDYIYPPHNHIITGNLDLIANPKLQSLMRYGVKFREPVNVDHLTVNNSIFEYLDYFVQQKSLRYNIDVKSFDAWLLQVKEIVSKRILFFTKINHPVFKKSTSIFEDETVKSYIQQLHSNFIITVADKASNNFVLICKKFYTQVLMCELGIDPISLHCVGNSTYDFVSEDKDNIILHCKNSLLHNFNIICDKVNLCIPNIFWNPKLHKTPYKARFIAGARKSCNKQLETLMNKGLFVLKKHFSAYCDAIRHRTGINFYWSINSSQQFVKKLHSLEVWSMQIYDFSTLYTKLDLQDVETSLFHLCDLLFRSNNKFLCINPYKAFFSTKKHNNCSCFDLTLFKKAITFILNNTYVSFGGFILRQSRGIPMGGGSSSPIADLYLSVKEFFYMSNLLKAKRFNLAKSLSNNSRYIDDVNIINFKNFLEKAKDIYPRELLLERSGEDDHNAVYLDIRIQISNNFVKTSLYNKTDDFNFPVVCFTFPDSCVPARLGYQVFYGQVLRYSYIFTYKEEFIAQVHKLLNILVARGYKHYLLFLYFRKCLVKNINILFKYGFKDIDTAAGELIQAGSG